MNSTIEVHLDAPTLDRLEKLICDLRAENAKLRTEIAARDDHRAKEFATQQWLHSL